MAATQLGIEQGLGGYKVDPDIQLTGDNAKFFFLVNAGVLRFLDASLQRIEEYLGLIGELSSQFEANISIENIKTIVKKGVQPQEDLMFNALKQTIIDNKKIESEGNLETAERERIIGMLVMQLLLGLFREAVVRGTLKNHSYAFAQELQKNPISAQNALDSGMQYFQEAFLRPLGDIFKVAQIELEHIFHKFVEQDSKSKVGHFVDMLKIFFVESPFSEFMVKVRESALYLRSNSYEYLQVRNVFQKQARYSESRLSEDLAHHFSSKVVITDEQAAECARRAGIFFSSYDAIKSALGNVRRAQEINIVVGVSAIGSDEENAYHKPFEVTNNDDINPIFQEYFEDYYCQGKSEWEKPLDFSHMIQTIQGAASTLREYLEKESTQGLYVLVDPHLTGALLKKRLDAEPTRSAENRKGQQWFLPEEGKAGMYEVLALDIPPTQKRWQWCPKNPEVLSALLSENPALKAMLLSFGASYALRQMLTLEPEVLKRALPYIVCIVKPVFGVTGFVCGYAIIKHPEDRNKKWIKGIEALSDTTVILCKSLSLAIFAHLQIHPEDFGPDGISLSKFLALMVPGPAAVATLNFIWRFLPASSIEKSFIGQRPYLRATLDAFSQFSLYWGIFQLGSLEIFRQLKWDFSDARNQALFEFLPGIPALLLTGLQYYRPAAETAHCVSLYLFCASYAYRFSQDWDPRSDESLGLPEPINIGKKIFWPVLTLAGFLATLGYSAGFRHYYTANPTLIVRRLYKPQAMLEEKEEEEKGDIPTLSFSEVLELSDAVEPDEDGVNRNQRTDGVLGRVLLLFSPGSKQAASIQHTVPLLDRNSVFSDEPEASEETPRRRSLCPSWSALFRSH